MTRYTDRIAGGAASLVAPGEVVVAAVPANGPEEVSGPGLLPGRSHASSAGRVVLVREPARPAELPFVGRMVLVATDRRLRVYERRRWRAAPSRLLGDLPLSSLGNVEGIYDPAVGTDGLGLSVILTDGTAVSLDVPPGFLNDGKEFVQRLQVLLRS